MSYSVVKLVRVGATTDYSGEVFVSSNENGETFFDLRTCTKYTSVNGSKKLSRSD